MKRFLLILALVMLNSCGGEGGTTTGNPIRVNMQFSSYNNSAFHQRLFNWVIPSAYAIPLSEFKMCFKRVRFKADSGSAASDIELQLGELPINLEGTLLGEITVFEGTYKRVEFDLEKDCDGTTKPSVTITNGHGSFTTNDRITIKFDGSFNPADGDLTMFVQLIVDAVKNKDYTSAPSQIKTDLEGTSGTF